MAKFIEEFYYGNLDLQVEAPSRTKRCKQGSYSNSALLVIRRQE